MGTNKGKGVAADTEMGASTSHQSLHANWIADIEARVNTNMLSQEELLWKTASIYKVPVYKRELNPIAFTPMLISLGPFHHDNPELKKMVVHKERALVHFLKRANQPLQNIEREVAKIITELRDAYCCLDDRWKTKDDEFLKMMILDGCFILEILQKVDSVREDNCDNERGYSNTDPYFSLQGIMHKCPYIRRDMLLIENQLPLILLKTLVHFQILKHKDSKDPNRYINRLVLNIVDGNENNITANTTLGLHALDLFRSSLLSNSEVEPQQTQSQQAHTPQTPEAQTETETQSQQAQTPQTPEAQTETETQWEINIIRCAVELNEAGVRFKRSETTSLKSIKFNSTTGMFHLPFLMVDDVTECSLLNVITFEYLHPNLAPDVTAYVCVMDEIIDSANDVRLLHRKGLILSSLGNDQELANIFNRIGKEITMPHDQNLCEVRKNVSDYCRRRIHRWRAHLIHTYFRNPWTAISLAGALLIIALTIVQTVYASRQN